jgi:protein-tyrosine phosphatase
MIRHLWTKKLEYSYITDGIYIGTNMCCQTHFEPKLKQEGIEVDISLEGERVDHAQGVPFYIWLPVPDLHAPSPDQFEFGVNTTEKFKAMGKKMYIHCKNGHGRAPTMVAAYLMNQGKSANQAIEFIKSRRPEIHLEDEQLQALNAFQKTQS